MACQATKRTVILALLIAAVYAILTSRALAASTDMFVPEPRPGKLFSVEVKPFPSLITLVPGGRGVGLSAEARLFSRVGIFADLLHTELHLSEAMIRKAQEGDRGDESIPTELYATSLSLGGRLYGYPEGDTWYVGAKAGGGPSHLEWAYGSERLTDRSLAWNAEAQAGYRWLWSSGVLVRLGFGLGWTLVSDRDVAALAQPGASFHAARRDVESRLPDRPALGTTFDLGVGIAF